VREKVPFLVRSIANKVLDGQDNAFASPDLKVQLNFLEEVLAKNGTGFFVGDHLTGADIIYIYPLNAAKSLNYLTPKAHPKLTAWLEMVSKRDGFIRAQKKVSENS
jgi:glutathione S-transferase